MRTDYAPLPRFWAGSAGTRERPGLSVSPDKLEDLQSTLERYFEPMVVPGERKPPLIIDALVRPETINFETVATLEVLDPCGESNPGPVLLWHGAEVISHKIVGKGHISMNLRGSGKVMRTITFRPKLPPPSQGQRLDVAFEARREIWNESPRLSLRVRDWRPGSDGLRVCGRRQSELLRLARRLAYFGPILTRLTQFTRRAPGRGSYRCG